VLRTAWTKPPRPAFIAGVERERNRWETPDGGGLSVMQYNAHGLLTMYSMSGSILYTL